MATQKIASRRFASRIVPTVKALTKVGIVGGVVYFTFSQGVWDNDGLKTEKALKSTATTIDGYLGGEYLSKAKLPESKTFVDRWNNGVNVAFDGIVSLPNTIKNKTTSLTKKFSD